MSDSRIKPFNQESVASLYIKGREDDKRRPGVRREPRKRVPREKPAAKTPKTGLLDAQQVARIENNRYPMRALFRETFIRRSARVKVRSVLTPNLFISLLDMLDGRADAQIFTDTMRALFHIHFNRGDDFDVQRDVGYMRSFMNVDRYKMRWIYQALDGVEPLERGQVEWFLSKKLPLRNVRRKALKIMWAYSMAADEKSFKETHFFPKDYDRAVRLALIMGHLVGEDLVEHMYPLRDSAERFDELVKRYNFGPDAHSVIRNALRVEERNGLRVRSAWASYFTSLGRYERAVHMVAEKARRFERISFRTRESRDRYIAFDEYWRAADIARHAMSDIRLSLGERQHMGNLARAFMGDVLRLVRASTMERMSNRRRMRIKRHAIEVIGQIKVGMKQLGQDRFGRRNGRMRQVDAIRRDDAEHVPSSDEPGVMLPNIPPVTFQPFSQVLQNITIHA